jgi:hypothetical protein
MNYTHTHTHTHTKKKGKMGTYKEVREGRKSDRRQEDGAKKLRVQINKEWNKVARLQRRQTTATEVTCDTEHVRLHTHVLEHKSQVKH